MDNELKKIRQNNQQINEIIEKILSIRRQKENSFEKGGQIDSQMQKLLEFEVKKCLEIYRIEFSEYICQGKDTVSFREPKETADCYGGSEGLQITYRMQDFIKKQIIPQIQKLGYWIDENSEPSFDEDFKANTEHSPNSDVKSFKTYVGSNKDQMDYFALLLAKNGIDMDFVWDVLAHEEMHTFGVTGGNTFLKEGITEELTREICEKYNIHMSPHAHTQEANFVRKLEMIVGRENVIEAGMWTGKFKKEQFKEILESNPKLSYSELSEIFELLKSESSKLENEDIKKLSDFSENNPRIVEQLKTKVNLYRNQEKQQLRYSKVAKMFDKELNMKEGSFFQYAEILENMYALTQNYKKDPRLYRDVYSLSLDKLEDGYIVFQTKEGFKSEDKEIISNIRRLFNELSIDNGIKINSFSDLMEPINEKVARKTLEKNEQPKDYSRVIEVQQQEMEKLQEILTMHRIESQEKLEVSTKQENRELFSEYEIGKATINTTIKNKDKALDRQQRDEQQIQEESKEIKRY